LQVKIASITWETLDLPMISIKKVMQYLITIAEMYLGYAAKCMFTD